MDSKKSADISGPDKTEVIKNSLPVIYCITVITTVAGLGCLICGILTIVLSADHYYMPFTTGSGIWTGVASLIQGVFGFIIWKNFNISFPHATSRLVFGFYVLGILGLSIAPQHLSYSIQALFKCVNRETDKHEHFICNPEYRDNLIIIQAFNIAFAVFYDITSIVTLGFMVTKRRLVHLTGNPRYMRGCLCCYNSVNYDDV